jgi:hypothetical protein
MKYRLYLLLLPLLLSLPSYAADPGDACTAAQADAWEVSESDAGILVHCDGARWRILGKIDESGAATSRIKQVITFGNDTDICDSDVEGTVRYTGGGTICVAGGIEVGGHCWYFGSLGQSCTQVCSGIGAYSAETLTYAGSGGTNANCTAVLDALGAPGSGMTTGTGAYGCAYSTSNNRRRYTSSTTEGAATGTVRRACACGDGPIASAGDIEWCDASAWQSLTLGGDDGDWLIDDINGDLSTTYKVGIGTDAPAFNFHVHHPGFENSGILLSNAGTGATGAGGLYIGLDGSDGTGNLWNMGDTRIRFATNYTSRMLITGSGNVGIGTEDPKALLDVTGGVRIGNDTGTCAVANEGTLRYTSGTPPWEYCNGSAWVPFESAGAGAGCAVPALCPNVGDVCDDGNAGNNPDPKFAGCYCYYDAYTTDAGKCKPIYVTQSNQSDAAQWRASGSANDIAFDSMADGKVNQGQLVAGAAYTANPNTFPAFKLCEELNYGGHTDWYLPAREELHLLFKNKSAIGNFNNTDYWSSTENENSTTLSWGMVFTWGYHYYNTTKGTNYDVRCVRRD